jgi:hypothetical protein
VLAHGLGERAEQHARLGETLAERGRDRNAVEHGIDGDSCQPCPLVQRHAELLVGREQLGVDILEALGRVGPRARRRVIRDRLVVDVDDPQVRPAGLLHREPVPIGLQSPFQHERGFLLLGGDEADHGLVEAGRDGIGLDVGDEAVPVFPCDELLEILWLAGHDDPQARPAGRWPEPRSAEPISGRQCATAS